MPHGKTWVWPRCWASVLAAGPAPRTRARPGPPGRETGLLAECSLVHSASQRYLRNVTYRPAPRDLRASDSDRDGVMALLSAAAADGRLTLTEHAERVELAHTARTLGELAELTSDLAEPSAQPFRLDGRSAVLGVFGQDRRDGRWVVPASLPVLAVFGEVVLDLRDALLQSQRIVVYATVVGGTLEIMVPDGVVVELSGTSVLTRKINRTQRAASAGMPVVDVRTLAFGGTIRVISPRRSRWLGGRRSGLPH
jgi:hypothetical protein